jgi:nucleotide-binding universal stress UspA family protein
MSGCILVPVDGSDLSLKAVDVAADLARSLQEAMVICFVVNVVKAAAMTGGQVQFVGGCLEALWAEGESIVKAAADRAGARTARVETRVVQGSPSEEIMRTADELHAGWIVMGSHGRNGLSRALMGSVAEGVIRHSNVPVLIVPRKSIARSSEPLASSAEAAS